MRIKFKIAFQPSGAPKWKFPQPMLEFYRGAVNTRYHLATFEHLEFGVGSRNLQFEILEGPSWLHLFPDSTTGTPRRGLTSNAFLGPTNDTAVPPASVSRRVKLVLRVENDHGFHDIEVGCMACQVRRYAA